MGYSMPPKAARNIAVLPRSQQDPMSRSVGGRRATARLRKTRVVAGSVVAAAYGTAGITIVAQALMPGSTTAAAQTATPVVRRRARAKPVPSTRNAAVSDEVHVQKSSWMAGTAVARNRTVSPGIMVAVTGTMSARRSGGTATIRSTGRSVASQPVVASTQSSSTATIEIRDDVIAIGLTTGVGLRCLQLMRPRVHTPASLGRTSRPPVTASFDRSVGINVLSACLNS